MVVGANELANMFGIRRGSVYQWMGEGMPVHKRGSGGVAHEFETEDVIRWHEQRAIKNAVGEDSSHVDINEAKRRKLLAEAGIAEINLNKEKGKVVLLEDIERELSHQFALLRSRLRKVPERCVLRVIGQKDQTEIKNIILDEIDQCLDVLSRHTEDELDDA